MSFRKKNSIVFKVTLWYSVFILVLLSLLVGGAYLVATNLADAKGQAKLQEDTLELAQDIKEYESFDDGIYYALYAKDGTVLRSSFPRNFKQNLPFSQENVKQVTVKGVTYQYFDVRVKDSSDWLRAIRLRPKLDHEMLFFLGSLALAAPLLVVAVVFGGYRILKRAFIPVEQMSQTALAITKSHDYTKRIPVTQKENELSRLAQTFNKMLASIERSFEREKQFNHDVSHELRTPIAVILAESEYAKDYATQLDEAKDSAQTINRQAKNMKELLEQLLELTRLEAGQPIPKATFDLSEMLAQQLADQQKILIKKGLILKQELEPEVLYYGNELLCQRLVANLLSNACKFAQKEISVTLKKQAQNVILTVTDDGHGIKETELDKIWDKFYQSDQARSKAQNNGVGLGLALVKDIVLKHQGQVKVTSTLGKKTTFTITLPLRH